MNENSINDSLNKFLSPYNPSLTEKRIYEMWENSGYFNPDNLVKDGIIDKDSKSFTIVMPPANANGSLHAGHGLVMTIEDVMTRYKRMKGYRALWLPGLDHAGFETQVVYERKLEKEGRTRFDLKPEDLYKEILDFTLLNSKNIQSQIRSVGASCDWSRQKFTLDPDIVKIVYGTFENLYKDDLLYRGKRIVSWCPKHQTSFSDLEIKDEEKIESFYYFKYGPFVIGTSRPETKFGDKYIVVHPDDKRYSEYKHGQKIDLEWINGPITSTVIKDDSIDMTFGTGAMTITPWHDATDFAIASKYNLEKEQVIDGGQ
jgi:valyl-tRNA synthetase